MTDIPKKYRVEVKPAAAKFLAKLAKGDKSAAKRVTDAMLALAEDPRPHGYEPVRSMPGHLRVRAGDYRVVYRVQDEVLKVEVVTVGHRSDVYD